MENILEIKQLSKKYGNYKAVKNVSFSLSKNSVLGIVGHNGSGKTSLLSLITAILTPTAGSVIKADHLRIGAMIDTPGFYGHLTAYENLSIIGEIKDLPDRRSLIADVITIVGLTDYPDRKFNDYSLGMKQRLGIAGALLGSPDLVILD